MCYIQKATNRLGGGQQTFPIMALKLSILGFSSHKVCATQLCCYENSHN
jgi:hypothetical protein